MIGIPSDTRIEPAHILVTINGLRIGGLVACLVEFQPRLPEEDEGAGVFSTHASAF